MAVVLPNLQDAPAFDGMAVRDAVDFFAVRCMNSDGTCVISGCAVTQHTGSDMAINVASGVVAVAGTQYTVTGVTNVAIGAASSSDRRDTVVYTVGTGVQVIAGGPCGYTSGNWSHTVTSNNPPVKQYIVGSNAVPANSVILAEVYVATTTTAIITATNCVDKRLVSPGADVIGGVLQGSTNTESIIRANTLNQMGAPTSAVNMNSQNFTNTLNPTASSQVATVASITGSQYAFVVSGCAWTPDAAGSTLNASMTAGTVMIGGLLLTVSAITAQAFTANRDTYVDFTNSGSGTATVTYSAVVNNSISPALAGTSPLDTLRNAIITSGGSSIANQAACNQGDPGAPTPATTAQTTTVAAGSNTNPINTSTLSVAANSMPAAGYAQVDTSAGAGVNFGSLIQYTSGGGTTTLSGITVICGGGTVSTGGVVTSWSHNNVSDALGNPIFPTSPYPTGIGFKQKLNSFTTTKTTLLPIAPFTALFIVPPGPPRRVRLWTTLALISASAGSANASIGYATVGTTFTQVVGAASGAGQAAHIQGEALLAPGTYVASVFVIQGSAGTLNIGASSVDSTMGVDLVS